MDAVASLPRGTVRQAGNRGEPRPHLARPPSEGREEKPDFTRHWNDNGGAQTLSRVNFARERIRTASCSLDCRTIILTTPVLTTRPATFLPSETAQKI
jgi:hypothetical protein